MTMAAEKLVSRDTHDWEALYCELRAMIVVLEQDLLIDRQLLLHDLRHRSTRITDTARRAVANLAVELARSGAAKIVQTDLPSGDVKISVSIPVLCPGKRNRFDELPA